MTRIKAVNLQATNKASIYSKQTMQEKGNYPTTRQSATLIQYQLYRTRPPTAVTQKPKGKKKEKGTSLVASWAGPLAWAERSLTSARTALVRHNEPLSQTPPTEKTPTAPRKAKQLEELAAAWRERGSLERTRQEGRTALSHAQFTRERPLRRTRPLRRRANRPCS